MSQLILFRNVLLVSLIAILMIIMYKRLIALIQKQNVQVKYPSLDAALHWIDTNVALGVELKSKMSIHVAVFRHDGTWVKDICQHDEIEGKLNLSFDTNGYAAGRYYFEIITPREKALRYFDIA